MSREEKRKEHKRRLADDNGEPSLGRWIVYYGTIMSGSLVILGMLISIYEVFFQPYILPPGLNATPFHSSFGMPMIVAGVGIYTSGAIAKSWQAQAEAAKMVASMTTNSLPVGDPNAGSKPTGA